MAYDFHYTPTGTGVISGKEVLEQTEDAINDLGNTAISGVQEALDKAEQALTNSENAVDDAQTALNTANNAEGVAIQAQTDVGNLSGTVANIGNRVTTAEGNISNLQGRMTTAEGNITNLQGRMTTAESNIGNLQTAVSTAQATANSAQQTATTARQQSYVFRYSSTALTPSSTNSNALLDNTDNLKVGDKVIDSNGVLFSITAIDTANSTFTIGTALIDLAQDSDVVHKSGDETIGGTKTFSNGTLIVNNNNIGSNVHSEIKFVGSRSGYIVADNAADGVFDYVNCGVSILLQDAGKPLHIGAYKTGSNGRVFADNTNKNPVLSLASGLVKTSVLVPENDTANVVFRILSQINYANGDTSKVLDVRFVQYDDANASSAIYSNDGNKTSLGVATKRWSKIYGTEYYYGSNNVEFSTKFVTTDTNQTISGNKTFSSNVNVYNSDSATDTANIILKNSKAERGSTTNIGEQNIFFLDKDNAQIGNIKCEVDANGVSMLNILCVNSSNSSAGIRLRRTSTGTFLQPTFNNGCNLGTSGYRWYDVQTRAVNSLEPSSLSLPSGNVSDVIDISSYITDLSGGINEYTAPANGWITVTCLGCTGIKFSISNFMANGSYRENPNQISSMIPICKNQKVGIYIYGSSPTIQAARFIPCQGNV